MKPQHTRMLGLPQYGIQNEPQPFGRTWILERLSTRTMPGRSNERFRNEGGSPKYFSGFV
jgi:hypothetical protein